MGQLGSGSGSSYPTSLDTSMTEVDSPAANKTKARAAVPNDIYAAVIQIETTLGTSPQGSIADVKTYLQTEHNTNGTHKAVTGGMSDGTNTIKIKVINIGDWNMDSTTDVSVAHGIASGAVHIVNVSCAIQNDVGVFNDISTGINATDTTPQGFVSGWDDANVYLYRKTGGSFDGTSYDQTSYNRGKITIIYI